jgi:hypothetical protein
MFSIHGNSWECIGGFVTQRLCEQTEIHSPSNHYTAESLQQGIKRQTLATEMVKSLFCRKVKLDTNWLHEYSGFLVFDDRINVFIK